MAKISVTDILFVNVLDHGRSLLQLSVSGITSAKELMQQLREMLHQYNGKLLTLQLRNSTRGWSRENQMLFAA
ncbi:MAG: hypothetical protein HDR46_06830 [Bacteroides sp.]|nr:hypothetical protein [Bacteroidales bacterium]MBD5325955.1 hypothetical protein [Bacteroides sp.]MDE6222181.1 hypothetical protein [Muribaculaceae bacterium]MBD5327864.1 hypothetical protein [Bacteroides sp.]MBD5415977.1 hypothetical protein [Bacteroides sp.]